jgi:hypothetical protein
MQRRNEADCCFLSTQRRERTCRAVLRAGAQDRIATGDVRRRRALRRQGYRILGQGAERDPDPRRRQPNVLDAMISSAVHEVDMQARRGAVLAIPLLCNGDVPGRFGGESVPLPAEKAICGNANLSTFDERTRGMYFIIVGGAAPAATVAQVRQSQSNPYETQCVRRGYRLFRQRLYG